MNTSQRHLTHWLVALIALFALVAQTSAQGRKKNPTSKLYVAEVTGESQIDTGETIDPLTKRSVYSAQGTVIETQPDSTNALVFSNGTGIAFNPDTRLEVRKFVQEPFTPNRRDMEVEPSISNTQAYLPRGTVGLCTSRMVAGSSMRYSTPHSRIRITARKAVIESTTEGTTISVLDGSVTAQSGDNDVGGQTIENGQQLFIPASGGPIQVRPIPQEQLQSIDDMVAIACMARKTVYFDSKEETGNEVAAFDGADGADGSDDIVVEETTPPDINPNLTVSASRLPASNP